MSWLTRRIAWLWSRLRLTENLAFAVHAGVIVAIMAYVRPLFTAKPSDKIYDTPVIAWTMLKADWLSLQRAFQGKGPPTLYLLFLVVPTVILLARRRRLLWRDFDHGKKLRNLVMLLLAMLVWSGATYDYNSYLDRGHFFDRGLLVVLGVASYFTPLAVPFALKWAYVMLKEAYVPIGLDDFDFRSIPEVLVVFSCFVWAGLFRSYRTRHFLFTGIACWASYYFAAGVAKMNVGPETWSWTLTDHVSNLSMGAHIRGWMSWVPDDKFIAFNEFVRKGDLVSTGYTMVLELGALFLFWLRPKLTRWMFVGCFSLHFGIFFLTGICFWKWMFANLVFFFWLGRGGEKPLKEMFRPALAVLVMGSLLVFYSRGRDYFFPQTGVAWYDSRMVENYLLYAIGKSGKKYFLDTGSLAPMDMHWTQGRLCYATTERSVTGIYGVGRNYSAIMALDKTDDPQEAMRLLARGKKCDNPKQQAVFDDFFKRYFRTLNKKGRQHRWLAWIGRPRHLWIFPTNEPRFEDQEPIAKVEMWREVTVYIGGKIQTLDTKRTHVVDIPAK